MVVSLSRVRATSQALGQFFYICKMPVTSFVHLFLMPTQEPPLLTRREDLLARLETPKVYDMAIVGGGATGLGLALDAAARGYSVVLVESNDFAKGTSSRSTKLVHGGVRYLAQGNIALVREALHERSTLLHNAPHIAQPLPFVMPCYAWWEKPFYGLGLKMYDALAGKSGLGQTEFLSRQETLGCLPSVRAEGLRGGVKYWDGQFNDSKLALALARSAALKGALLLNYLTATTLRYADSRVAGIHCTDTLSGKRHEIQARCVVNATGVWVDALREQDGALQAMVAPSQGVHIVVDKHFLPGQAGLMIPKTADGRVLFAVPWLGKVILGTTDTPRHDLAQEPLAFEAEIDFILNESARYLKRAPQRSDVKSIWVGLRPLVKPPEDAGGDTKILSREHTVLVSRSGLVTVTGGKWTTYRAMAEDVLQKCLESALIAAKGASVTGQLKLVGAENLSATSTSLCEAEGLHSYGSEQGWVDGLPGHDNWLSDGLSEAMVRFAARCEYAVHVEDVLARRSRLLFLDARLAAQMAPVVADILRSETGLDPDLAGFLKLAKQYVLAA
jgi:glycerol-3-phosphate dehydrogenase